MRRFLRGRGPGASLHPVGRHPGMAMVRGPAAPEGAAAEGELWRWGRARLPRQGEAADGTAGLCAGLGVDERPGDPGRSDTMLLVRVGGGPLRVLSLPGTPASSWRAWARPS